MASKKRERNENSETTEAHPNFPRRVRSKHMSNAEQLEAKRIQAEINKYIREQVSKEVKKQIDAAQIEEELDSFSKMNLLHHGGFSRKSKKLKIKKKQKKTKLNKN